MIDVGVRAHHGVDIARLDPGFRHALLLAARGRPECFRRAHAGVEQDQLVAVVHDRRVLLEHDIVGIEEVVGEHLPHFFIGHANEGALGRAERQRAVGDHRHFGVAENEAVPVGRLRAEFWRLGQRAAAEKGRSAKTGAKRKQRPSRNVHRHTSSSTVFMNCSMLPGQIHPQLQAAPASRNWQVG